MSKDILIYENGTGGEMRIISNDLAMSETLFSQVYLAFFGGNVEASTKGNELEKQERFDWWANSLLFRGKQNKQFNSNLERVLSTTVYNSSGRIEIENAAKKDLQILSSVVNVSVQVSIVAHDKIRLEVKLTGFENGQESELQFIWNNASKEIILEETI